MRQKDLTSQMSLLAPADLAELGKAQALPGWPSKPDSPVRSPWLYVSLPLLLWLLLL
jgi:hypothetical protein